MLRRIVIVVIVVVVAVLIHRVTSKPVANTKSTTTEETAKTNSSAKSAPALSLSDIDGRKIDTASYKGKVVLVNFWAAWCTPCAAEVPQLIAMHDKYRNQGFEVIGYSMEDQEKALRDFCTKNKVDYPIVVGNQEIAQAYGGILGLPTSILIDREGNIRSKYPGLSDVSKLEKDVVALLSEKK